MSLSTSLSIAMTGLTAMSRYTEVTSGNISNALTEGYARRTLELGSSVVGYNGSGVQVNDISRFVDTQLLNDLRLSYGETALSEERANFYIDLEDLLGSPETDGSLSALVAEFEATLVSASNNPGSDAFLLTMVDAATALSNKLNEANDTIQEARMRADQQISTAVDFVNTALVRIQELNEEITRQESTGYDASALYDQRQLLVDEVADIIPVKELERDFGQIALMTPNGTFLLDRKPATLSFNPVGFITADMSLSAGSLGGLSINGIAVDFNGTINPIDGGRLQGYFEVRDDLAVKEQENLDAMTRDLIERFQDPAVDPSLVAGEAGLFTDLGADHDLTNPLDELGLADRIRVNPAVDPAQGGSLSAIRDGLGAAATARELGDATVIQNMLDALSVSRVPVSGGFSGASRTFSGLASEFGSIVGVERLNFEQRNVFASIKAGELLVELQRDAVDTDQELQTLLIVEQAYAANARVIQTVDSLIQRLLEI
ncbi:MAG: flagellar hook-associated protein FlgK [Pseudomonadota bacterium]